MLCLCALAAPPVSGEVIVGTKHSKVYHTQAKCKAAAKISEENRVVFKSAREAEREGRRLCRACARLAEKASPEPPEATGTTPPPPPREKRPPAGAGRPTGTSTRPAGEPGDGKAELRVRVRRVLAGGTLELDGGEKVAMMGVGLPEEGQALGAEAVAAVAREVRGHKVLLTWDPRTGDAPARDQYGRRLVYVRPSEKKPDLGAMLISDGLAWRNRFQRCARGDAYSRLEDEAWSASRGIWKRLDGAAGKTPVVFGQYGEEFHPRGCPHIVHLTAAATITVNEAKARRLTPCQNFRAGPERTEAARPPTGGAAGGGDGQ
jgi:endonuclease YncB( thermonuclease family)